MSRGFRGFTAPAGGIGNPTRVAATGRCMSGKPAHLPAGCIPQPASMHSVAGPLRERKRDIENHPQWNEVLPWRSGADCKPCGSGMGERGMRRMGRPREAPRGRRELPPSPWLPSQDAKERPKGLRKRFYQQGRDVRINTGPKEAMPESSLFAMFPAFRCGS